jgi:hypothetical protein
MQWEYKIVALGLLVDATEPHQREKHEQILNDLGREEWEAVAYGPKRYGSSETISETSGRRKESGSAADPTAETT